MIHEKGEEECNMAEKRDFIKDVNDNRKKQRGSNMYLYIVWASCC